MSEQHSSGHHGSGIVKTYLAVFIALIVFTAVSFVVNDAVHKEQLTTQAGFTIILSVAVCKAVLVAMFFMHLYFDWGRLYFMIFPVAILGVLLVVVLLPDMVIAWRHYPH